jgi:hypothetical protein
MTRIDFLVGLISQQPPKKDMYTERRSERGGGREREENQIEGERKTKKHI